MIQVYRQLYCGFTFDDFSVSWVRGIVAELGLRKVGWMMPMAVDSTKMTSSGISNQDTSTFW